MKLIRASWAAPATIHALTTTRLDGASEGCFSGLNLGDHVGDNAEAVSTNRTQLIQALGLAKPPQWLEQVHGTDIVEAKADQVIRTADGCWTRERGLACVVMTADCLPVLLCNKQGTQVAAAHAGWRGLVNGMLEQAVASFENPADVLAWMGPAIGPRAFEVGGEVRSAFIEHSSHASDAFLPSPTRDPKDDKWLANLYLLARQRLEAAGVKAITGADHCTFTERDYFYSYRRDGQTGRMASLIWIDSAS